MKFSTLIIGLLAVFAFSTRASATGLTPAQAAGLNLGVAADYALVDLASGTTIGINNSKIVGATLLGHGVKANASGGNGGGYGTIYYDPTVLNSNTLTQLQPLPTITPLSDTSITSSALQSAIAVSSYAAQLTATQSFATLSGTTTISSTTGLNVIGINNFQNVQLTINGGANDYFIFNISGTMSENKAMTLSGGVTASHILFNFTSTSGNVFQTSGGGVLYGTYLATNGGGYAADNLTLTGELINTGGNVQYVSGADTTFAGFTVPATAVPEPESYGMMLGGLGLLGFMARRKKNA